MYTNPVRDLSLLRALSLGRLDRDRRLTLRRHVDHGRCASAFCTAG